MGYDCDTKGITFGAFDLVHTGHVMFLNSCRKQCDHLTVGLHLNPRLERFEKNKPVQSLWERFNHLRSLESVDDIIPYETEDDLMNILSVGNYDFRFLGSDYGYVDSRKDIRLIKEVTPSRPRLYYGEEYFYLGKESLIIIERNHNFSSTNLRKFIVEEEQNKNE